MNVLPRLATQDGAQGANDKAVESQLLLPLSDMVQRRCNPFASGMTTNHGLT